MPKKEMHCVEYTPIWNPVSKWEDPIKAARRSGTCEWYIFHKNRPCHPFISTFYCLNGFEEEDKSVKISSKMMAKAVYNPKAAFEVKKMFEAGRKKAIREEHREAVDSLRKEKDEFTVFWTVVYTALRDKDKNIEWVGKSDVEIREYVRDVAKREYATEEKELATK